MSSVEETHNIDRRIQFHYVYKLLNTDPLTGVYFHVIRKSKRYPFLEVHLYVYTEDIPGLQILLQ